MTTVPQRAPTDEQAELTRVVVSLLRGVIYREDAQQLWQDLHRQRTRVGDHVAVMGLTLVMDEAEGYACLRQVDLEDAEVPRLVPRHRLSFRVSLLLALLRRRLAEADATSAEPRLILTRDQVVELMSLHLPDSDNAVRIVQEVDTLISKVVDLGFLRKVRGQEQTYEVRRILKAFVDAQWLAEFDTRLREYVQEVEDPDE